MGTIPKSLEGAIVGASSGKVASQEISHDRLRKSPWRVQGYSNPEVDLVIKVFRDIVLDAGVHG